jgi:hypothetical protein
MTLFEQLGNAGSEVGRAIRAKEQGSDRFEGAFVRALDLLDLTLSDPRWHGHRLREIARAREVTCDFLVGDNDYGSTSDSLDSWFLAYAMAARRGR